MSGAVTTKDENIDENDGYFHINWEKIKRFAVTVAIRAIYTCLICFL